MLDQVTAALAAIESEGAFATELAWASEDLRLEVVGVGPVHFPITAAAARRLCAVARPAPYGKGQQTLVDARVRDTWEIPPIRIKIDARAWKGTLGLQLDVIGKRLGLPEGGRLEAVLDKLLVYGPGQFFAPHQDSERSDDMVGSLVVELPSRHDGGAVVVQHHRKKQVFKGAPRGPRDLSLLAFYADCHHEVKPVGSGYRITLTYRLLYRGATDPASLRTSAVDRLAASVEAYFSTPVAPAYGTEAPERPDRMVYLLDHEYTQKSLGWSRLKNADRLRVAALRQVADRLDCEASLALADVHESWMCEEDDWDGPYGGRYDDYDEEDEDEDEEDEEEGGGGAGDPELVELIESSVELRHWVGPDGSPAPGVPASLSGDEVCFTRASDDMDPFQSEHEGYMGNYGNTVDRWYHRAALVMWPRDRDFVIRARVSPSWAVGELASRIRAGTVDEARARARELLPFWSQSAPLESSAAFARKLLAVLASLDDAEIALGLLSPLGPHQLEPRATPAFVALVERHGFAWAKRVFEAWAGRTRHDTPPWLSSLPRLCTALVAGGEHGKALGAWLLAREVASFEQVHHGTRNLPEASREDRAERRLDDLSALLETAAVIGAPALRDDLIAFLAAPETALPILVAGALLQKIREGRPPAAVRALGLGALHHHVEASLQAALAAPARSPGDWSMAPPRGCACVLCKELSAFLRDKDRIVHAWPLAKERRQHIHGVIDRHRLPVTHVTTRTGSPYKLVLTKQEALFERDAARRAREKALLAWVGKQRKVFGDDPVPARAPGHGPRAARRLR